MNRTSNSITDQAGHVRAVEELDLDRLQAALKTHFDHVPAMLAHSDDDFVAQWTRRQPTHLPGMLRRQEVIDYYLSKTDWAIDDFTFYDVFSSYRLAAITQQIYFGYYNKRTRNPQFKHIWVMVNYLLHRCCKSINRAG